MYEFAHIGLVVSDVDRSGRFYADILGCRPAGAYEDERVKIKFMQAGSQTLELIQHLAGGPARRDGVVDHLAFKVDDMEAAVRMLKDKGVTLLSSVPRSALKDKMVFFFAGPDGERLEFMQEAVK
jgi:Lactoylglutathione lyase and related lyases